MLLTGMLHFNMIKNWGGVYKIKLVVGMMIDLRCVSTQHLFYQCIQRYMDVRWALMFPSVMVT